MSEATFKDLDLGSGKPTSVKMETINVEISADNLLGNYAKAFINECQRINPRRAEQVQLTEEEMKSYIEFLLTQRILSVKQECPLFRKLKPLYIPVWIQYVMSTIGVVTLRDIGLKLVPGIIKPSKLTLEDAMKISDKVGMFIDDVQIVQDAMPRAIDGDANVMSTALIAGYVRAIKPVEHVSATYVTAFLGMKLKEETAMSVLYRVQYDDAEFIASALTTQKGLF